MKGDGKPLFGSNILLLFWRYFSKCEIRFLAFFLAQLCLRSPRVWTFFGAAETCEYFVVSWILLSFLWQLCPLGAHILFGAVYYVGILVGLCFGVRRGEHISFSHASGVGFSPLFWCYFWVGLAGQMLLWWGQRDQGKG